MRRSCLLASLAWGLPAPAKEQPSPDLLAESGTLLARLVGAARQQAIAQGVRPIPVWIRHRLLGYFPASLLDRVRYCSGATSPFSLPGLAFGYGDARAMTLGEVVLFNSEATAQTDVRTWAHELTHVMQYQRWGLEGFADRYVRETAEVEQEAIDNANRFEHWRQAA